MEACRGGTSARSSLRRLTSRNEYADPPLVLASCEHLRAFLGTSFSRERAWPPSGRKGAKLLVPRTQAKRVKRVLLLILVEDVGIVAVIIVVVIFFLVFLVFLYLFFE